MNKNSVKQLLGQGLAALKAGGQISAKATSEIYNDAHDTQLKEAIKQGTSVSKKWMERIDQSLKTLGSNEVEENPVVEALYKVSEKVREKSQDDMTRDLGIVAASQLALHYWIAAFGTLRTYAAHAGWKEVEQDMQACLQEAKQADEHHNHIASQIFASQSKLAA